MKLRGIALHSSNAGEFHEIEFLKQHTIYTVSLYFIVKYAGNMDSTNAQYAQY